MVARKCSRSTSFPQLRHPVEQSLPTEAGFRTAELGNQVSDLIACFIDTPQVPQYFLTLVYFKRNKKTDDTTEATRLRT
jgi:hypothetical protein